MSNPIEEELERILGDFDTWCMCGEKDCVLAENFKNAKTALTQLIAQEVKKGRIDELESAYTAHPAIDTEYLDMRLASLQSINGKDEDGIS